MERFCRRFAAHMNFTATTDRRRAIEGADFINTQIRVGGNAARVKDEKIPLIYGLIGQETTGASRSGPWSAPSCCLGHTVQVDKDVFMMPTRMWQEIQDQPDVAERLIQVAGAPAGPGAGGAAQGAPGPGAPIAACRSDLHQVTRLILSGTGASLAACRVGQYAFMQYAGLLPHVLPAAELDYVQPAPGTLVILVSQSGQSLETQTAVDTLKARSIPFWGITNNPDSYLAQHADRALLMNAGEEVSSATKTYLATLMLFGLLAGGDRAIGQVPADLRATLAAAADPINRWAEALLDARGGYILGMGSLGATASQGALLMKEKTFLHIEGMSLSEFRHGNIEVVTPGLPIIVLAVTPAESAAAVQHAEYFASIGADVRLITDSPVVAGRLPADRILQVQNSGDAYTGQIQVVVPLQLLAERVAVRKGHDVDGFRYIAKVVDKYKL